MIYLNHGATFILDDLVIQLFDLMLRQPGGSLVLLLTEKMPAPIRSSACRGRRIPTPSPRRRRKRIPKGLHFGHTAVFQLVDGVEEEDDPCFVSFHLNWANKGLALAVGEALQKENVDEINNKLAKLI